MTKSSSSKKIKPGSVHSKYGRMRKKLRLPSGVSPVPYVTDIEEDEINTIENYREGFQGVESRVEEQAIVLSQEKTKKAFQRASPMKLVSLYPFISRKQEEMIRNADYGGLRAAGEA